MIKHKENDTGRHTRTHNNRGRGRREGRVRQEACERRQLDGEEGRRSWSVIYLTFIQSKL